MGEGKGEGESEGNVYKKKERGPENFERVITLEFAMVFGKLDNFEYLRDRIEKMF